jgi:AcrR family transcriptional regulator
VQRENIHFKSKEELLVALIEDATTRMASVARTLEPSGSIEDSLTLFINRFLRLQLTLLLMPELKKA